MEFISSLLGSSIQVWQEKTTSLMERVAVFGGWLKHFYLYHRFNSFFLFQLLFKGYLVQFKAMDFCISQLDCTRKWDFNGVLCLEARDQVFWEHESLLNMIWCDLKSESEKDMHPLAWVRSLRKPTIVIYTLYFTVYKTPSSIIHNKVHRFSDNL